MDLICISNGFLVVLNSRLSFEFRGFVWILSGLSFDLQSITHPDLFFFRSQVLDQSAADSLTHVNYADRSYDQVVPQHGERHSDLHAMFNADVGDNET